MANTDADPAYRIEFTEVNTDKKIIISLWIPIFDCDTKRYYCFSEMYGLDDGAKKSFYSDTQFGVLMLSLLRFRKAFEKLQGDFRTDAGDAPHMFFPMEIPWAYGSDVYEQLYKMVVGEVSKIEERFTVRREGRRPNDEV